MLYLIVALVLVLVAGAAGAWFFLQKDGAGTAAKAKPPAPPVFLPLDPFTVNLQAEGGEQFLQVGFTLQVARQPEVDSFKLYMPQVRSRVLLLCPARRRRRFPRSKARKALADEIIGPDETAVCAGREPLASHRRLSSPPSSSSNSHGR